MSDHLTGLSGYDLYRMAIDAKTAPQSQLEPSRSFVSEPGTRKGVVTHSTNLPLKFSYGFTLIDRSEIYEMLEFFTAVRGQLTPFWWCMEQNLFAPSADFLTGQTVLSIEDNGFVEDFAGYERIFMRLISGDLLTYQVDDVASGLNPGDPMSVTIETALDRDVDASDIDMFGKLLFCRLDTDELSMSYKTSDIAECSLEFIELVEEYPA